MFEFGKVKPMLCNLKVTSLSEPDFIWERKIDGFRALAFVDKSGGYRLQARSLTDKTALFPELKFKVEDSCILDGEIVCHTGGNEEFMAVQHRVNNQTDVDENTRLYPAVYHVFDILQRGGMDLTPLPWVDRRASLENCVINTDNVKVNGYSLYGAQLFDLARSNGWEGVVGKDIYGGYEFGKRRWIKVKTWLEGEFKAVGYTKGTGKREPYFGALVLENGTQVGSGFTDEELSALMKSFMGRVNVHLTADKNSWTWAEFNTPIAIKVKYVEVTNDGQLRFPIFKGVVDGT